MHHVDKGLGHLFLEMLDLGRLSFRRFKQVDGLHAHQVGDVDDDLLGSRRRQPPRTGIVAARATVVIPGNTRDAVGIERGGVVRVRLVGVERRRETRLAEDIFRCLRGTAEHLAQGAGKVYQQVVYTLPAGQHLLTLLVGSLRIQSLLYPQPVFVLRKTATSQFTVVESRFLDQGTGARCALDGIEIALCRRGDVFHGGAVLVGSVGGRIGGRYFWQVAESVGVGDLAVTLEPERFVQAELLCGFRCRHCLLAVFEGDVLDKGTHLQRVGHFSELGIGGIQA